MPITARRLKETSIFAIMDRMRINPNSSGSMGLRQAGVFTPVAEMPNQRGFTLIEVMIVIVIIGVMASVAIPAFSDWRHKQAVRSASQSLMAHLKQARVAAISENRSVSLTFASGSFTYDADISGTCGACKNQTVSYSQFSGGLSITRSDNTLIPTTKTFSSRGTSSSTTLYLCSSDQQKRVVINVIGRAYECSSDDTTTSCTAAHTCP